jgi:glycosyltransferase involved in cell wall biosynthesis
MPKISFVIPTKNRAGMIRDALCSLQAQTEAEWEAVVVDDHGGDRTEGVIRELGDVRISYHRLPENRGRGVAPARNYANLLARSPLLAVLDSDDLAKPHRASRALSSYAEQGWDFYSARAEMQGRVWGLPLTRQTKPPAAWDPELFKRVSYVAHSTVVYTRQAALEIPYNSALPLLEDYDLISRFIELGKKIYFDRAIVAIHRRHPESVTAMHDREVRARYLHAIRAWRRWERPSVDDRGLAD